MKYCAVGKELTIIQMNLHVSDLENNVDTDLIASKEAS